MTFLQKAQLIYYFSMIISAIILCVAVIKNFW